MSVDSNYNSQFIQIDFKLLDDPRFLQFVNRAEFATYLILRRHIWRGGPHRLGLHKLYADEQKLASSVGAKTIASRLGLKDITRVSKHLTLLEKDGVITRIRTGRESIFVLGEWHRPRGWDVSKEFYYLENRFGQATYGRKSDLAQKAKSDLQRAATQTWLKKPSSNKEENEEESKTVSNSPVRYLPDLDLATEQREFIAGEILDQLGDSHSLKFYTLVAAKVPEAIIREVLAQIKVDGAEHPAKAFTYRMNQYAMKQLKRAIGE